MLQPYFLVYDADGVAGLCGVRLCLGVCAVEAANRGLSAQRAAVYVLAAAQANLVDMVLFALLQVQEVQLLLYVFDDGLDGVLGEGFLEVAVVVVDDAAVGGNDDVSERWLHEVLDGVVAERLEQPAGPDGLLMLVIFEGQAADEDDDLAAEPAHLHALLEVVLRVLEDEAHRLEEERRTVQGFLGSGTGTCAKAMSAWKMRLRVLKMDSRMLIL